MTLPTDKSVSLGVIATEWVTNAFKYAYPRGSGEIRVSLKRLDEARAELLVEDDGVGRGADQLPQGTGLGTQLVNAMAASIGAQVEYLERHPGMTARLIIPASCIMMKRTVLILAYVLAIALPRDDAFAAEERPPGITEPICASAVRSKCPPLCGSSGAAEGSCVRARQ